MSYVEEARARVAELGERDRRGLGRPYQIYSRSFQVPCDSQSGCKNRDIPWMYLDTLK